MLARPIEWIGVDLNARLTDERLPAGVPGLGEEVV